MNNFTRIMLALIIASSGSAVQVLGRNLDVAMQKGIVETALQGEAIKDVLENLMIKSPDQVQALDVLSKEVMLQSIQANEGILKALENISKKFEQKKEKDPSVVDTIQKYVLSPVWKTVLKPFVPHVQAYIVIAIVCIVCAECLEGGYDAAQVTRLAVYLPYTVISTLYETASIGFGENVSTDLSQVGSNLFWAFARRIVPGL